MISILIDFIEYTGFTSATVSRSFLDASGQFNITITPDDVTGKFPIQAGQFCIVKVSDQFAVTGYVEKVSLSHDGGSIEATFSGRDALADLIDSTIDSKIIDQFSGSISLQTVCQTVITKLGLQDTIKVKVEDGLEIKNFSAGDFLSAHTADTAFNFLDRYARKRQVFLTTDGLGSLVIARGADETKKIGTMLVSKLDGTGGNILKSSSNIDLSKRFNLYRAHSQSAMSQIDLTGVTASGGTDTVKKSLASVEAEATDDQIRQGRVYNFIEDTPTNITTSLDRATWESNFRRSQSIRYTCTVVEHTYDGQTIWQPNIQVQVIDERLDINAVMIVDQVTFVESVDEGRITELSLVPSDSYKLISEQNFRDELAQEQSNAYVNLSKA
jgi:prophage tail gpP-like protein